MEQLPDTRFIFISRNIWDVASSFKRRALNDADPTWGSQRGVSDAIAEWNAAHQLTLSASLAYPGRVHVVNYELFLGEAKGLAELFQFLELDLSPGVIDSVRRERLLGQRKFGIRPEVLSTAEKLSIMQTMDLDSYRRLNCAALEHDAGEAEPDICTQAVSKKSREPTEKDQKFERKEKSAGLKKYQAKDLRICDYHYTNLPGTKVEVRGPLPGSLAPRAYVAFLGGAQTFGRFVEEPFPTRVSKTTGWPSLNLAFGGAKPEVYLETPGLIAAINNSAVAVIQIMSARGSPNSVIRAPRIQNNVMRYQLGDAPAREIFVDGAYRLLLQQADEQTIAECVKETRSAWVVSMKELLALITVPKILFWFSTRPPAYQWTTKNVHALMGAYPQFVNADMVAELKPCADLYVECVSDRGMPAQLLDRETGEPVALFSERPNPFLNTYYPSVQMHEDATAQLRPALAGLLAGARAHA